MNDLHDISGYAFKVPSFELLAPGEFSLRAPADHEGNIWVGVYPRNFGSAVLNLSVITGKIHIQREDERPLQVKILSSRSVGFVQVFDEPIESLTLMKAPDETWGVETDRQVTGEVDAYSHFIDTLAAYAPHAQANYLKK